MKNYFTVVLVVLISIGCQHTPDAISYFPYNTDNDRYEKFYAAMEEKSIWSSVRKNPDQEVYRLLSLPTFGNPMLIKIEVLHNGNKRIVFKRTSGKGGYEPGQLELCSTNYILETDFGIFTNYLQKAHFWSLPHKMPQQRTRVMDGSNEIIEVIKDGQYHVVNWHCPEGPFLRACYHLIRLLNPGIVMFDREPYIFIGLDVEPSNTKTALKLVESWTPCALLVDGDTVEAILSWPGSNIAKRITGQLDIKLNDTKPISGMLEFSFLPIQTGVTHFFRFPFETKADPKGTLIVSTNGTYCKYPIQVLSDRIRKWESGYCQTQAISASTIDVTFQIIGMKSNKVSVTIPKTCAPPN